MPQDYRGKQQGKLHSIIIKAEGTDTDGRALVDTIQERTGKETKLIVLSYLQRGGSPTLGDRMLATMCGAKAGRSPCGRFAEQSHRNPRRTDNRLRSGGRSQGGKDFQRGALRADKRIEQVTERRIFVRSGRAAGRKHGKDCSYIQDKFGATEKYARWIGEELECPVISADDFNKRDFEKYDNIVFGGGVHAEASPVLSSSERI